MVNARSPCFGTGPFRPPILSIRRSSRSPPRRSGASRPRAFERLERRGIDQREIVDPRKSGAFRSNFFAPNERRATGLPLEDRLARASSAAGKRQRAFARRRQDRRCATTARGRRRRAPSARRRSRRPARGPRPSAGSPRAAGNPSRRTRRHRAAPRAAAWRPPSRPRRNGPAAPRLPALADTPDTLTVVAKPAG
jgi:hypothetical protein